MRGKAVSSWLFLGALFVLCGVLGVLQYRWIGEVHIALRERLRGTLEASLNRASMDFNSEISSAARGLIPSDAPTDAAAVERAVLANLDHGHRPFQRIAVAIPYNGALTLRMLDLQNRAFTTVEWPVEWSRMHARLMSHLIPGGRPQMPSGEEGLLFESPVIPRPGEFGRREIAWVVYELNLPYLRDTLLPEVLQRDLDNVDYQIEVVDRGPSQAVIYRSDAAAGRIAQAADASAGILDASPMRGPGFGRGIPQSRTREQAAGAPPPAFGRWILYARHKAGGLEAAVSQVRTRNLAVTAGVLALLIATAGALVSFTRRAQRLAGLQMDFVAGISHELRTPLTVIHTAAYNLRGRTAANPAQVERYGELIQRESERLKDLVEQVLRYAGVSSGRVIREPEPISVGDVIGDTIAAGKGEIESAHGTLEASLEPGLPAIMGDPLALKHAFGNLLSNAAKYGLKEHGWVGISAMRGGSASAPEVEIRVADRGPGIPHDEQPHIFDAFFRGKRAILDQVHGTGLGLNLVKEIVEAHGGSIRVKSEPSGGTEFIVRLPALSSGGPA